MRKKFLFLSSIILFFFCVNIYSQNKRALLIGISDYGNINSGSWANIHGANDVNLISPTLRKQGFSIVKLCDKNATAKKIRKELSSLATSCKKGDYVFIHFSGHGQPFEDLNGDEEDGWDESIIPYDAQMRYVPGKYEGKNHITDDELTQYVRKLRSTVGSSGFVCVVIDACHAGGSSRSEDEESDVNELFCRGTNVGFSPHGKEYRPRINSQGHFQINKVNGLSHILIIEACRSYQTNYEIKENGHYYGPLTFYLNKVLSTTELTFSNNFVLDVKKMMDADRRLVRQNMVYESSIY